MSELQRSSTTTEVYGRLIDRLSVALDSARTAARLRGELPADLELRGLSRAELELINVYLNRIEREADKRSQGSTNVKNTPHTAKIIWLKDRVQKQ